MHSYIHTYIHTYIHSVFLQVFTIQYYMNANASKIISDWFAVTYGIFGALLSPFMGLLLDR